MPSRFLFLTLVVLVSRIASFAAQPIVGVWPLGDGSGPGSGFIAFFPNGYYVHVEDSEGDQDPDGLEKGTYVWDESTGAIGAVPIVDTNGEAGLSHQTEEENLRLTVSGDTLTVSTTEDTSEIQRLSEPVSSILGAWTSGDVGGLEQIVAIFLANGNFIIGEEIDPEGFGDGESAMTGMERGTYTWDSNTNAFSANVLVDTNGDFGISSLEGLSVTFTPTNDTLVVQVDGEDDSTVLSRLSLVSEVAVNRSIEGAWSLGMTSLLVFPGNGIYYNSTHIMDDLNPQTGMERGSFALDPESFAFDATPTVDTNADAGVSGGQFNFKTAVHDDRLFLYRDDDTLFEFSRVKGEENELLGAWQFGDPATADSGIVAFFDNSILQNQNVSGFYIVCEDVGGVDEGAMSGTELGLYKINATTQRLDLVFVVADTNGDAGLSDFDPFFNPDFDPSESARLWALDESLVIADRGSSSNEVAVLTRVSEAPPENPRILLDKLSGDEWILLHRGIVQGSLDLSDWVDAVVIPDRPTFLVTDQMAPFYRARED